MTDPRRIEAGDLYGAPVDLLIFEPKRIDHWPAIELIVRGEPSDPKPVRPEKLIANCTGLTLSNLYHGALPVALVNAAVGCAVADLLDACPEMEELLAREAGAWRGRQGLPMCICFEAEALPCSSPCGMPGCERRTP